MHLSNKNRIEIFLAFMITQMVQGKLKISTMCSVDVFESISIFGKYIHPFRQKTIERLYISQKCIYFKMPLMVHTALYNSIVNVEKFCCSHTFAKCLLICCLFVQKCVEKALTRLLFCIRVWEDTIVL